MRGIPNPVSCKEDNMQMVLQSSIPMFNNQDIVFFVGQEFDITTEDIQRSKFSLFASFLHMYPFTVVFRNELYSFYYESAGLSVY